MKCGFPKGWKINKLERFQLYWKEFFEFSEQVPALLFLQSMLVSQDSFPQHYADYLNGCGLEIESLVRNAFYNFIRKLAEIVSSGIHLDDIR